MTAEEYNKSVKELMTIPGVARSIADDLIQLGIKKVSDLKDKDPERLYSKSNRQAGIIQDKNVLYMFRCAVYFASNETHDTEKLKWSNWK
ncbi:MAG: helix-hairpin-helix domain-containing protein [Chitinophagales bacterium]